MAKINREISSNFATYEALLQQRKHTKEKILILNSTKPNRKDIRYLESIAEHTTLKRDITLIIESKIQNDKDFKFKLRCAQLSPEPFFRFDSAGAAHRNADPTIKLEEQMVTTPHFNCFDSNGRNIAYKTDELKNNGQAKALEDINFCFVHFCFESNTRFPTEDYSEIITTPEGQLNLGSENDDILSNINFGL
ncbi:hypothetical protein ACWKWU_02540 [Chitinophaga lutea]